MLMFPALNIYVHTKSIEVVEAPLLNSQPSIAKYGHDSGEQCDVVVAAYEASFVYGSESGLVSGRLGRQPKHSPIIIQGKAWLVLA